MGWFILTLTYQSEFSFFMVFHKRAETSFLRTMDKQPLFNIVFHLQEAKGKGFDSFNPFYAGQFMVVLCREIKWNIPNGFLVFRCIDTCNFKPFTWVLSARWVPSTFNISASSFCCAYSRLFPKTSAFYCFYGHNRNRKKYTDKTIVVWFQWLGKYVRKKIFSSVYLLTV